MLRPDFVFWGVLGAMTFFSMIVTILLKYSFYSFKIFWREAKRCQKPFLEYFCGHTLQVYYTVWIICKAKKIIDIYGHRKINRFKMRCVRMFWYQNRFTFYMKQFKKKYQNGPLKTHKKMQKSGFDTKFVIWFGSKRYLGKRDPIIKNMG